MNIKQISSILKAKKTKCCVALSDQLPNLFRNFTWRQHNNFLFVVVGKPYSCVTKAQHNNAQKEWGIQIEMGTSVWNPCLFVANITKSYVQRVCGFQTELLKITHPCGRTCLAQNHSPLPCGWLVLLTQTYIIHISPGNSIFLPISKLHNYLRHTCTNMVTFGRDTCASWSMVPHGVTTPPP